MSRGNSYVGDVLSPLHIEVGVTMVRKRVVVVCMLERIHSARWLSQFQN
jgi:hypothetical protein